MTPTHLFHMTLDAERRHRTGDAAIALFGKPGAAISSMVVGAPSLNFRDASGCVSKGRVGNSMEITKQRRRT